MSNTQKGSPKLGTVPKSFKRLQNKSQMIRLKENEEAILENPEMCLEMPLPKPHVWDWF